MKKYIESLREKSDAEKNRFAFTASAVITSVIVGIWFAVVFTDPSQYFESDSFSPEQNMANAGSLFDVFDTFQR